ncbi:MAG: MlaD family protein [Candidatus Gastranaerophilaceae bacterium]
MKDKTIKTKYPKKKVMFLELFIWFLVFTVIAIFINFVNQNTKNSHHTYQIFLQDVDGIIVGSPVRMMGIPIGYVKKVRIVNDMVFVEFMLTEKNMEIPKGSRITVEFTGLGGSKSIEIYTPNQKVPEDTPTLVIQQTRRLGEALSLLDSMLGKITAIMFKCSNFANSFDSHQKEQTLNIDSSLSNEILNKTDKWLDKMEEKRLKHK